MVWSLTLRKPPTRRDTPGTRCWRHSRGRSKPAPQKGRFFVLGAREAVAEDAYPRGAVWRRLLYIAMLAGCYAPHPVTGAPCDPAAAHCPTMQSCELVAGTFVCVADGTQPMLDAAQPVDAALADGAQIAPWMLVQSKGATSNNVLLQQPTGAGHLLVVAIEGRTATAMVTSLTDDAGNVYLPVVGARCSTTAGGFEIELWYAKDCKAGATKVIAATGSTGVEVVFVWEVSGIRTDMPIASVAELSDQPASTTPVGARITTTVAGELVISAIEVNNNVTGLVPSTAFTSDGNTDGDGWAHVTDHNAPPGTYQAMWTGSNPGVSCASSAAFLAGP
jgi:hypothetical protein